MSSSLDFPSSAAPIMTILSANESFLESERPKILKILRTKVLLQDLAKLITDYVVYGKAFDHHDWKLYFGYTVEPLELDDEFYKFWFAKSVQKGKLNCDIHFPPVLAPQFLTKTLSTPPAHCQKFSRCSESIVFNFKTLKEIAEKPLIGNPTRFDYNASIISGIEERIDQTCWLVASKELFARGLSAFEQITFMKSLNNRAHVNYEELPRALDISFVAIIRHLIAGELYLGNSKGFEKRWSKTRCKNVVKGRPKHITVGGQSETVLKGQELWGGINVSSFDGHNDLTGVVGLIKFNGKAMEIP